MTSDLDGVGTGPLSTAAFTPANNSLQVVAVYASAESDVSFQGSQLTLSNSAGLTCTSRLTSPFAPEWGHGFRVWTCPVTTGTSMTFTADAGSYDIHQYVIERFQYTGHDTSTPTGATTTAANGCAGSGAFCPVTLSLSAAPASTSQVLAFASVNGGCSGTNKCDPAPGPGWTEIHDVAHNVQSWGNYQSQARASSTSTSVAWANLNSGNRNPHGAVLGALEIRASSGGGGGGGTLTRTDFAVTSDLDGVGTGAFPTATFTPTNNSLLVQFGAFLGSR